MPSPTPRRIHTPWQLEVEKIEQMIAETRRAPRTKPLTRRTGAEVGRG